MTKFVPTTVGVQEWVAPLFPDDPEQHKMAKASALRSCLVATADVVRPGGQYFLEVTERTLPKDTDLYSALARPYDEYHVRIRIWEGPKHDINDTNSRE